MRTEEFWVARRPLGRDQRRHRGYNPDCRTRPGPASLHPFFAFVYISCCSGFQFSFLFGPHSSLPLFRPQYTPLHISLLPIIITLQPLLHVPCISYMQIGVGCRLLNALGGEVIPTAPHPSPYPLIIGNGVTLVPLSDNHLFS